jgi:hypothetical protein
MLRSNGKDINNPLSDYVKSLQVDIIKYKATKIFKAIKRIWSLSLFKKDYNTLNSLKKLIKSNIALLAQINADIETLKLLITKNKQIILYVDSKNEIASGLYKKLGFNILCIRHEYYEDFTDAFFMEVVFKMIQIPSVYISMSD